MANQSHCDWVEQLDLAASKGCSVLLKAWPAEGSSDPCAQLLNQDSAGTSPAGDPHALKNLDLEAKRPGWGLEFQARPSSAVDKLYKLSGPQSPHL